MTRLLCLAAVLILCCVLSACGNNHSSTSSSGQARDPVPVGIPASGCGSIATPPPVDTDGVLAQIGPSYAKDYAGYSTPISAGAWRNFKPSHPPPYKIGLAFAQLTADAQVRVYAGLKKQLGGDPGIKLTAVTTGDQVNLPQQLQQFQSLLQQKPDLLIVQPIGDAFAKPIAEAAKAGIPTISLINTTVSPYAVNVVPNNYANGAQAASVVLRQIQGRGNVLLVHGIAAATVDQQRFEAYRAALKNCPGVKVVGEIAGAFAPATAKAETLKYLATHPGKVDAVLQTSGMAPGIISAFEQAGRSVPVVGDVGAMKGSLAYWRDHRNAYNGFGMGYPPNDMATAATAVVKGMLAGDGLQISDITAPYVPVTPQNLDQWADSGWDLNTPGIADGPGGTFMSKAFVAGLFKKNPR